MVIYMMKKRIEQTKKLWLKINKRKTKVLIAPGICGLSISDKAVKRLFELGVPEEEFERKDKNGRSLSRGTVNTEYYGYLFNMSRSDPRLIQVVEELGHEACGEMCHGLAIIEVPAHIDYVVESDGETGYEWIAERHKQWHGSDSPTYWRYQPVDEIKDRVQLLIEGITEYPWSEEDKIDGQQELAVLYKELIRRGEIKESEAIVPEVVIVEREDRMGYRVTQECDRDGDD